MRVHSQLAVTHSGMRQSRMLSRCILLLLLLDLPAACAQGDAKVEILSPAPGAVVTGGVVHLNYTISYCPPDSHVSVYLNDVQLGGDDSVFWCKRTPGEGPPLAPGSAFMWHGLSGVQTGSSTAQIVLYQGKVALSHANVHFDVVEGHGRFFGVNHTTLVDGHGTAAYFRSPVNRSTVRYDPNGIVFELLSLNFIPGLNGYTFKISADSAPQDVLESNTHEIFLRLNPGTHCLTAHAFNADLASTVGTGDKVCLRVVPPELVAMGGGPPPDCQLFKNTLGGVSMKYGLIIDTPKCEISLAMAAACSSCNLILCAPQEGDGPQEEVEEVFSRDMYRAHAHARVRKVAMQDVPSLQANTLDFIFVRQLRIDTSVDQQAEIESVIGLMWGLVKQGGYFGFFHDVNQVIIVVDADGGLWEQYADYPKAIKDTGMCA